MPTLTFITPTGERHVVDAAVGISVMRAATGASVPGIIGECGGCATCLTCHCYVETARQSDIPSPTAMEAELLAVIEERRATSRLTCQIVVREPMDGMIFEVPRWQG